MKSQGFQSLGREGRVSLCPGEVLSFWAWGAMGGYGKAHKATPLEKVATEGGWRGRTGPSSPR